MKSSMESTISLGDHTTAPIESTLCNSGSSPLVSVSMTSNFRFIVLTLPKDWAALQRTVLSVVDLVCRVQNLQHIQIAGFYTGLNGGTVKIEGLPKCRRRFDAVHRDVYS